MSVGLDAAAEDRKRSGVGDGKEIGGDGGGGGGAHFGYEAAIHDCEEFARFRREERDQREMGGKAEVGVARENVDQFGAHDIAHYGGHHGEPCVLRGDGDDGAEWLLDAAGGVVDQGVAQGGDQVLIVKAFANLGLAQENAHVSG